MHPADEDYLGEVYRPRVLHEDGARATDQDGAALELEPPEPPEPDVVAARAEYDVGALFAADGPFATYPGYAPREGQIAFARAVRQALDEAQILAVEAPTGLGKSVGYLTPAIQWISEAPGRRVVVCTANIALQEQLIHKDLPALARTLPYPVTYALAKGRGNYACLAELDELRRKGDRDLLRQLAPAIEWLEETSTGDMSELGARHVDHNVLALAQRRLTVSSEHCLGKHCEYYTETPEGEWCHAIRARSELDRVQVIVTNYHLYFTHLRLLAMSDGNARLLPDHDAVIMDEAHAASNIARAFFGDQFGIGAANAIGNRLPGAARVAYQAALDGYVEFCTERKGQKITTAIDDPRVTQMIEAIDRAGKVYREAGREAMATADERAQRTGRRYLAYADRATRGSVRLDALASAASPSSVYYVESDRPAIVSHLVDVGPVLDAHIWSTGKASILTSATLSIAGRMGYVRQELGLPATTVEATLPSPFDYAHRCRLIVPASLPLPAEQAWEERALEAIAEAIEHARGRTLVLCTTHRMLNRTYDYLVGRIPYTIYRQRHPSERTATTARFKADVSSVLIGTESYWAGVDVPGESLSCVIIDKLPFPTPDDPVIEALTARYPDSYDAFLRVSVPRAILQFKQGVGRLIRSVDDRGAVVCLDRRLVSKGYGRNFLRSLPEMPLSERLEDIRGIVT